MPTAITQDICYFWLEWKNLGMFHDHNIQYPFKRCHIGQGHHHEMQRQCDLQGWQTDSVARECISAMLLNWFSNAFPECEMSSKWKKKKYSPEVHRYLEGIQICTTADNVFFIYCFPKRQTNVLIFFFCFQHFLGISSFSSRKGD